MKQAHPPLTQTRVEAYVASALRLLGWLLAFILRAGASGRSVRLKHALSRAEHCVECILFLQAVVRYGPPPGRRNRPRSTPHGFHRRAVSCRRPLFFKRANIRAHKASPLNRVLAMLDALARPERAIAYFFKRICNGLCQSRLIAVAPPADALARDALMAALPRFIDTS
ncbi:MAG: hypothetical protein ACT4OF_10580 [Caulobacteraceae bacterium]